MSKLICFMALVALVALLACGGDDATEAPANTAAPQPTIAPTAMIEPTATPAPTNTPAPAPTNTPAPAPTNPPEPTPAPEPTQAPAPPAQGSDAIRPLQLDDPLRVAGELSDAELACASGVADLGRLMQIFSAPELADPDEISQLINCMEDETVLRLFITQLVGLEEPLSEEASVCVRAGIDGAVARDVIQAGMAGDAQSAMTGSMSAFFLVITCFNEEEFAAAAPSLGVPVDDREGIICLAEEIGGPEKVMAAFSGQDEDAMMALMGAAITCGLEMEGAPMPDPTMEPESGTMNGMPGDPVASILAGLSDDEIGCLAGLGISPEMLQDPLALESATPEQQAQALGCLSDETVANIFLMGIVGDPSQLSPETSSCIYTGMEGIDLRGVMAAGSAGDEQAAMVGGMSAMFLTVSCLNDQELAATESTLGMTPEDRDGMLCVMQELDGPEGLAEILSAEDESGIMALLGATFACGLDMEGFGGGS